ncbi:MAG: hypothetical protein JM58_09265 [Peptococcaceae bacterium BICA1-8]|nr:MAG: hypothetical protein JM58_09265 [Peptococcaceae bacterium BICA1-8]
MNNLQRYLSQYKLDSLISTISNISKDMYNEDKFWEHQPAYKDCEFYRLKIGDVLKTAWGVTDIIYNAIIGGNDFKGREPNKDDILNIFNEYTGHMNTEAIEKVKQLGNTELFYGLSQKQFWYQKRQIIYEQISRNIELLQYVPKKINSPIPIEQIIYDKVGLSHFDFVKIILLLSGRCKESLDFTITTVDRNLLKLEKCYTEENIRKVIDYFSADYNTIVNSPLEENFLHTKPFIKTQSGKIIAGNYFIVSKKCADGIYWLIRNYYEEQKKQDYTNEFGKYFETYFGDLLQYYLENNTFERLQEDEREKIADWAIYTTNYILLIEQKSSLASLKTKTEYPELNYLKRFLDNLVKAFLQLDRTEIEIETKKQGRVVVKVALLYEDVFIQSLIKEDILAKHKEEFSNTENFFIIGISEMEKLVSVLSKNEEKYERIIQDLILAQNAPIGEGRELEHILQNHKILENDYIVNVKNHLKLIFDEILDKR